MHDIGVRGDIRVRSALRSCYRLLSKAMMVRFAVGTAVVFDLALGTWLQAARAQEGQRASITVPPVTRAQPSSMTRLSIQVGSQEALPRTASFAYAVYPPSWQSPLATPSRLEHGLCL